MLLHQYRGCFSRIYVFSPSVDIDMTWEPVKKYVENDLKVNLEKEPCFFEEWEPERLGKIIDEQYKLIEFQTKKGYKRLFSICIVIDDFADRPTSCTTTPTCSAASFSEAGTCPSAPWSARSA